METKKATVTIPTGTLLAVLKATKGAMSVDETRGALCCINIRALLGVKAIRFEATDGHRLHQVDVPLAGDVSCELIAGQNYRLDGAEVPVLEARAKATRGAVLNLELTTDDKQGYRYPDVDRTVPSHEAIDVGPEGIGAHYNPRYLAKAFEATQALASDKSAAMARFLPPVDSDSPCRVLFSDKDSGLKFVGTVMPMRA